MLDIVLSTIFLIIIFAVVGSGLFLFIKITIENNQERKALDEKYNISKFPVTSKSGVKYFVEIEYRHGGYHSCNLGVHVYERTLKPNGKYSDKRVESKFASTTSTDYISLASYVVNNYEEEMTATNLSHKKHNEALSNGKKLFKEWDGIVKDELIKSRPKTDRDE